MLIIMLRSVLRIVKYIMFFCITIALISIILVYYYQKYDSKNVPTIVHNNKLTKIQPKDSGGLILPNSERLIYDHLQINSHKKNDKIIFLPEPEYPINFINQVNRNDILNQIIYNINSKDIKTNKKSTKLNIIKTERTYNKLQTNAIHHNKNKCYVIELGSVKSINSAKKETEKLKKKYNKLFYDTKLSYTKTNYNSNNFYIISVSELKSLSEAKRICKKLSYVDQECILVNKNIYTTFFKKL